MIINLVRVFRFKAVYILCLFFLLLLQGFSSPIDTIPPTGKLTSPKPFSVITGNAIRLSAQAKDSESGVKAVYFYAHYSDWLDSTASGKTRLLKKVTNIPYEFIWNVSPIPDQDSWRMFFYCDIEDSAGNLTNNAGGIIKAVVVDRNSELKQNSISSSFWGGSIEIDGSLDEWPANLDWKQFVNNDNHVRFTCL